jgi:hypothetical protein
MKIMHIILVGMAIMGATAIVTDAVAQRVPPIRQSVSATNALKDGSHGLNSMGDLTPAQKQEMLDHGNAMLKDLKRQIKEAKSDAEREALKAKKKQLEGEMIQLQQNY